MKAISQLILVAVPAFLLVSCASTTKPPATVATLDKSQYIGEWHEIARLPNFFERGLVAARANYGLNDDGSISVHNEGLKSDGSRTSIKGTAKPTDPPSPGRLLVRFDRFPANLFTGDYWVLHVNSDYTRALVGSPDRKFLWILDKQPFDKSDYQPQIRKAKTLGYDVEKLYFNPQRITD
jgi:apolipoprotein D and lipocalin family protein